MGQYLINLGVLFLGVSLLMTIHNLGKLKARVEVLEMEGGKWMG